MRDMPYIDKDKRTTIPAVMGDFCPACGEVVLDRELGDRYRELVGMFQRQANAAQCRSWLRLEPGNLQTMASTGIFLSVSQDFYQFWLFPQIFFQYLA